MRTEIKRELVRDGALVLYKNNKTVYKTSPARVTCETYYNVILYKKNEDVIDGECGIKTKREAIRFFKKLLKENA